MAEPIQKQKVREIKAAIAGLEDKPRAHLTLRAPDIALLVECAERGLPPDPPDAPAPTPAPAPAPSREVGTDTE